MELQQITESLASILAWQHKEFVSVDDIAARFGVEKKTVQNAWIVAPGFPKEVRFPTGKDGSGKSNRYYRWDDVRDYLLRVNGLHPVGRR